MCDGSSRPVPAQFLKSAAREFYSRAGSLRSSPPRRNLRGAGRTPSLTNHDGGDLALAERKVDDTIPDHEIAMPTGSFFLHGTAWSDGFSIVATLCSM